MLKLALHYFPDPHYRSPSIYTEGEVVPERYWHKLKDFVCQTVCINYNNEKGTWPYSTVLLHCTNTAQKFNSKVAPYSAICSKRTLFMACMTLKCDFYLLLYLYCVLILHISGSQPSIINLADALEKYKKKMHKYKTL